jgi:hypothetical protein
MTASLSADHSMFNSGAKFRKYKTSITKVMDADEFLRFISENKEKIKSSRVILPKLGSTGLGKFLVELE